MNKEQLKIEKAKKEERERIQLWGLEPCTEHIEYKGNPVDFDFMQGILSRRECPKCWQSLKESE